MAPLDYRTPAHTHTRRGRQGMNGAVGPSRVLALAVVSIAIAKSAHRL